MGPKEPMLGTGGFVENTAKDGKRNHSWKVTGPPRSDPVISPGFISDYTLTPPAPPMTQLVLPACQTAFRGSSFVRKNGRTSSKSDKHFKLEEQF
jgi:hypothetical protein